MPRALPKSLREEVVAAAQRRERSFSQIAEDFGVSKSYVQKWARMAERAPVVRDADAEAAAQRAATRGRLSELALEMFARDGYEETSVAAIAKAAGITERTFFNHFDTKLDSVFHHREYAAFGMLRALIVAEPPGLGDFELLCECAIRYMAGGLTPERHRSNRLRNRISESSDTVRGVRAAAREQFEKTLVSSLAERHGRERPNATDQTLGTTVAALLHQCFILWVEADDPLGFEQFARSRVVAFLAAVRE